MQNLDKKLENMSVPKIEDELFERKLSNNLKRDIVLKKTNYKLRYQLTAVAATLLVIFNIAAFFKPEILGGNKELVKNKEEKLKEIEGLELQNSYKIVDINDPEIRENMDVKDFEEDKTYIVQKYNSKKKGTITVISEFDEQKNRKKVMKLIDSSM